MINEMPPADTDKRMHAVKFYVEIRNMALIPGAGLTGRPTSRAAF